MNFLGLLFGAKQLNKERKENPALFKATTKLGVLVAALILLVGFISMKLPKTAWGFAVHIGLYIVLAVFLANQLEKIVAKITAEKENDNDLRRKDNRPC